MEGPRLIRAGLLAACILAVVCIRLPPFSPSAIENARARSDLTYVAADAREHVYLGDYDSYYWLRLARNVMRTGSVCSSIVEGECRDLQTHAPVGRAITYRYSLHVHSIAGLHLLISALRPGFPLPSSSYLVTVIVAALGVIPAFAIGRRLAGALGGLFAALLTSLNPIFLVRSFGSDNDVWNVVLPLFLIWAIASAVSARGNASRMGLTVCAAVVTLLHALTWEGWVFFYAVVLAGLTASLLVFAARLILHTRSLRLWQSAEVRAIGLVLLAFPIAVTVLIRPLGVSDPHPGLLERAAGFATWQAQEFEQLDTLRAEWPNVFATVSELRRPNLSHIAGTMGGAAYFFAGWLGLLLLFLPSRQWQWWHFALLIGGNYLYYFLLTNAELARSTVLVLLASPLVAAGSLYLIEGDRRDDANRPSSLVIIIWFLTALSMSYDAIRFVMLLGTPFAVAFAVAVGRLHDWSIALLDQTHVPTRVTRPIVILALAAVSIHPIREAYATARKYSPTMNDAWWETLAYIREQSPKDTVVSAWWDYGYWVAYAAERRVLADGGSLQTHVPHWFGRSLLADTERESIGLLRTLNCGSDAIPYPEGKRGAYGRIVAQGVDEIAAHDWVVELANRDRDEARAWLRERGIGEAAVSEVLSATHCDPPSSYLVLSSRMIGTGAWRSLGGWDLRNALVANRLRFLPEELGITELTRRFGFSETEARAVLRKAAALKSPAAVQEFIAPRRGYFARRWFPCRAAGGAESSCRVEIRMGSRGFLAEFRYVPGSLSTGRLRWRGGDGRERWARPEEIVFASEQRRESIRFDDARSPDVGVLVDVPGERILLGPPYLIRSTFTHLMFLDGRYARHFEKVNEKVSYQGERIITWRIDWDGS